MDNRKYWAGRFAQIEETNHASALERLERLDAEYRTAQKEVESKLSVWYQRVANNNGVDLREAKRLLSTTELKEFRWTVQDYIKHGKENGISADWTKELENASARFHVTRLQALQVEMQQTVEKLFGNQLDGLDKAVRQTVLDTYYHSAFEIQKGVGIGWNIVKINDKALDRIINRPWTMDGKNFSDRIWSNKAALTAELQKQLSQNLMLGRGANESIEAIMKKFNVSRNQAARLVLTESAYFASVAQKECFNNLGVAKYQIVATLDERTSDICRDMDGHVFDMKDFDPGSTAPPFHPYCRSVPSPYFADMAGIGERAARDPDNGQTYYVPRDMQYHDWEKTFVQGGSTSGLNPTAITTRTYSGGFASAIGQSHYDNVHDILDKCGSDQLQKAWSYYEGDVGVADINETGRECCDWAPAIHIDLANNAKGGSWDKPYQTVFHETGHGIDMSAGKRFYGICDPSTLYSYRYKNGLFPQTIKDEVNAMVMVKDSVMKADWKAHSGDYAWLNGHGYISDWDYKFFKSYGTWLGGTPAYSKPMAYKAVEKEISALSAFAKADLSDILEGATRSKINIGWGHGNKYWKNGDWTLSTEAFAEMVDSTASNPESLQAIQTYLPKSYGVFLDMLQDMIK